MKEKNSRRKIGYLTNLYPAGSHTFIRREIQGLEKKGYEVERFAIRYDPSTVTEPLDLEEAERTRHLLYGRGFALLTDSLLFALRHPQRFWAGLKGMWGYYKKSARGFVPHAGYLAEAIQLFNETTASRVAHIHCHFATNPVTVAAICKEMGGPDFSFTVHGPSEFDDPEGHGLRAKVKAAQFVRAITSFCQSQIYRWSDHKDWDKVEVVRCGIPDEFAEGAISSRAAKDRVVCVARLSPQKGQILLLEEFANIVKRGFKTELVLVGDGELRSELEERCKELGIEKQVLFTGWVDEATVRDHITNSRGIVLPSFGEGLPTVIMEAGALKRPSLSTNIAAISELVQSDKTGWLVTPGNREELRDALQAMLSSSPEELDRLGAQAYQLVTERHMLNKQSDLLATLFDRYAFSIEAD